MAITGVCPGTNLVAIGSGVKYSMFTYAGQLVGALLFASLFSSIKKAVPRFQSKGKSTLIDEFFNLSYPATSLVFGLLVSGALYLLEIYEPFAVEISRLEPVLSEYGSTWNTSSFSLLAMVSWHPVVAGIVVGSIQLFLTMAVGLQLGNSSQYVYLASFVGKHVISPESYSAYFSSVSKKASSWSQAVQSIGVVFGISHVYLILGAWLSLQLSGTSITPAASHASPLQAFLGGIVLIVGARLAGGCPSGHGLTGMAKLSVGSFVSVAFMFIGGGLAALFL